MALNTLISSISARLEELEKQYLPNASLDQMKANLAELQALATGGHLAYFYYATLPQPRYGYGRPSHAQLHAAISQREAHFRSMMVFFNKMADFFSSIKREATSPTAPYWNNGLLPVIDAISICGMINYYKPSQFVEIGSGNSTRFAALAVAEYAPGCQITSIDAYPGDTVEAFPHHFVRKGLEEADLALFSTLKPGDMVWLDGTHRAFSNTDVSVFFMDVLPMLKPGVIIGVHDIQLPWDYPPSWNHYYFNEQFLLASYLLGAGDYVEYLFPSFYINGIAQGLRPVMDPIYQLPELANEKIGNGGAFWFTKKK